MSYMKDAIQLYKYQHEGIKRLKGQLDSLLADPPGAGKTAQIVIACKEQKFTSILVICPASLKEVWPREWQKWDPNSPVHENTVIINSSKDLKKFRSTEWNLKYLETNTVLMVASYKMAKNLVQLPYVFDAIIYDESQALRSLKAEQTKACLGPIWNMGRRHMLVSGTPLPNGRAFEAMPTFMKLAPDVFKSKKAFIERYCVPENPPWAPRYVTLYRKSQNLVELGQIARRQFMIRRSEEECLASLPPIVRQQIPLFLEGESIEQLASMSFEYLRDVLEELDGGGRKTSDASISTMRRLLGLAKISAAVEFVSTLFNEAVSEEKPCAVVFAHHTEVLEGLKENFQAKGIGVSYITGSTKPEDRQAEVDKFQDKTNDIFLGSILASGTGFTLTRSNIVVIVEPDWVPSNNHQAEGRIFRLGQKRICRSFYLCVPNSLDEQVTKVLLQKQKNLKEIFVQKE